jgi:catechol 2,3-dioxygenase-like lactoylglutathione lyase family enzyme
MKMKSAAGIVCYVKDVDETAHFYEPLGFHVKTLKSDRVTVYINWFWIDFRSRDQEERPDFKAEATRGSAGSGQFLCLSVDNIDAAYNELLAKGLKPENEPRNRPGGCQMKVPLSHDL